MANKSIQKKEINYEDITERDLGEEVNFTFSDKAFETGEIYCYECKVKAKKVEILMSLPETSLSVRLKVFRCLKCDKEYLDFEESEKLDRLLILNSIPEKHGISYVRALNFDGDNIFVRFPSELTKGIDKNSKARIKPISINQFLVKIEKSK